MTDSPEFFGFGQSDIEAATPNDGDIRTATVMLGLLAAQQAEVERLDEELKQARLALQELAENTVPEALIAVGITPPTRTTIGGRKIEFTERFRCGQLSDQPSKDGKNPANLDGIRWLNDHGHGDLLKREIAVTLGRGEDSDVTAQEIMTFLRNHRASNQFRIDSRQTVHPQTLAAFSKEQVEHGQDVPLETLRVHRIRQVKVS